MGAIIGTRPHSLLFQRQRLSRPRPWLPRRFPVPNRPIVQPWWTHSRFFFFSFLNPYSTAPLDEEGGSRRMTKTANQNIGATPDWWSWRWTATAAWKRQLVYSIMNEKFGTFFYEQVANVSLLIFLFFFDFIDVILFCVCARRLNE